MSTANKTGQAPLASGRPEQAGPPLLLLALITTVLFLAGLFISALMAKGFPPAPTAPAATVTKYFQHHRSAVRTAAALQFGSSVPLAIYSATVSARLRRLGIVAPGATIALAGGLLSSAFLALSALIGWVLSRPEVVADQTLIRALQDFQFAAAGPAHVVFLGLLVAGVAVPGLFTGILPRPTVVVGLVIALLAELSTLSLAADDLGYLLPIARFPALIWLIVVAVQLPLRPRAFTGLGRSRPAA
jgi:hypothetical protein